MLKSTRCSGLRAGQNVRGVAVDELADPRMDGGQAALEAPAGGRLDDAAVEREHPPVASGDHSVAGARCAGIDAEDDHPFADSARARGRLPAATVRPRTPAGGENRTIAAHPATTRRSAATAPIRECR